MSGMAKWQASYWITKGQPYSFAGIANWIAAVITQAARLQRKVYMSCDMCTTSRQESTAILSQAHGKINRIGSLRCLMQGGQD